MFEGAEKKFEISVKKSSLLSFKQEVYNSWAEAAGAKILSQVENESWKAFLLSESSLFVSDKSLIILTCGVTKLIDFLPKFFEVVPPSDVEFLSFERKNEYFPHRQSSCFFKDVETIKQQILGEGYIFGKLDGHHVYLYSSKKPVQINADFEQTFELLMYNLEPQVSDLFLSANPQKENLLKAVGLDKAFEGWQVDQCHFDPYGYSMNAIKGQFYVTIHVTPEKGSSYVSFETNDMSFADKSDLITAGFKPSGYDKIYFLKNLESLKGSDKEFKKVQDVRKQLSSGYQVVFQSFESSNLQTTISQPLDLF